MPSDSLRSSSASTLVIRVARHRRPHHAILRCPRQCRGCRQRAPHVCRHHFSAPRRVLPTTPITTALVNTPVMSTTVQHLDHCAGSLRTGQVSARLVASGDIASLVPSDSLRSSSAPPLRVRFARCGLRCHRLPHSPLHLCQRYCGRYCHRLRQCARHDHLHYLRTLRHSVAVEAPRRRVLRRPFPFACAPGFFVPHRLRGLWFSHPTHPWCGRGNGTLDCATNPFERHAYVLLWWNGVSVL